MSSLVTPALGGIDVLRLPCMPLVLRAAMERAGEGRNLQALADTVAQDPSLAARFLTTALAGSGTGAAGSLSRHVEALSPSAVQAVLMRAATDRLRRFTPSTVVPDALAFWVHSLHCAHLAESIAKAAAYSNPEEAYLAGLFHDIGMMALAVDMPHTYGGVVNTSAFESELLERELDELHTSHAEVSAALATRLGLPGAVSDALLLSHAPYNELPGTHKLVRMLWVAEAWTDRSVNSPDVAGFARLIGMPADALSSALEQGTSRLQEALRLLNAPVMPASRLWRLPSPPVTTGGSADGRSEPEAGWEAPADYALLEVVMQTASLQQVPGLLVGAEDTGGVLNRLRSVTSSLFGLHSFAAFLHDPAARALTGWLVTAERLVPTELEIPLAGSLSLVARAAVERNMLRAQGAESGERLRGVDLEIARLLNAGTLTLVPLAAGGALLGVLVFGVAKEQAQRLAMDSAMLQRLSEMATLALTGRRASTEQQRLKEADLRERLRTSARRLVHEARNPLTVMKTHLELLGERVRNGQPIDKDIRVLREEIDRVSEIVGRIGTADLSVDKAQGPVDLNALIRELMLLYREPLFVTRAITVELELDARLPAVLTDANALKQVLLNFWKNASEAMSTGGQVRVRTMDRVNYEGQLMVEISVSDTGAGMPAEVLENVFSQRLTVTKGGERGYGLSNAFTLVKQLGGHLLCRSEPERGTTFNVLLPRTVRGATTGG
jgi:signal transduction histidine kinase/HD-like signal output (HDOD) protein